MTSVNPPILFFLPYNFLFFFIIVLALGSFYINFNNQFAYIHKIILVGFLEELCWICRASWEELISWRYWVFLSISMNMEYLYIYLNFLWFLQTSVLHIDLIYTLLDLYLSMSFCGTNLNSIALPFNLSLTKHGKQLMFFFILTLYPADLLWSLINASSFWLTLLNVLYR